MTYWPVHGPWSLPPVMIWAHPLRLVQCIKFASLLKEVSMDELMNTLPLVENPGYHRREIPRGQVGELSKVLEEALEALEAEEQGASVMVLVELSDLLGAVRAYLARHHPTITLEDLEVFSQITERAFKSGRRG